MKTIKSYLSILIFISISFITGCSDDFTISENNAPNFKNSPRSSINFEDGVFNVKIKLNSGETLNLNYENTNLILIHSYTISNCTIERKDLRIRSSNQADSSSLPCSWDQSGSFAFEDLSVSNISGKSKLISVSLKGYTLNN